MTQCCLAERDSQRLQLLAHAAVRLMEDVQSAAARSAVNADVRPSTFQRSIGQSLEELQILAANHVSLQELTTVSLCSIADAAWSIRENSSIKIGIRVAHALLLA